MDGWAKDEGPMSHPVERSPQMLLFIGRIEG